MYYLESFTWYTLNVKDSYFQTSLTLFNKLHHHLQQLTAISYCLHGKLCWRKYRCLFTILALGWWLETCWWHYVKVNILGRTGGRLIREVSFFGWSSLRCLMILEGFRCRCGPLNSILLWVLIWNTKKLMIPSWSHLRSFHCSRSLIKVDSCVQYCYSSFETMYSFNSSSYTLS